MLVRREFLQREEIWVDKFFYDWSIAVSAYLYDHRGIVKIDEPLNWHRSHENEAALKQNLDLFPKSKKKTDLPALSVWIKELPQTPAKTKLEAVLHICA